MTALGALLLLVLLGCSTSRPEAPSEESVEARYEAEDRGLNIYSMAAESPKAGAGARPRSRSARMDGQDHPPAPAPPSPEAASAPSEPAVSAPTPAPASPAGQRMVHYSGWATLRSTEPEKALDTAVLLVTAAGGYVESRATGFAFLRVPAERFDSLFVRLMRLAEVVDFGQEAEDITEAFQDTEMRLRLIVATLERLEALVKKAATEAQKLRLLRELKRLREEREVIESRRRELIQKARFASIRLQVQGHAPTLAEEAWRRDLADFRWIHALDPFQDGRFRGRKTLKFRVPEGLVVSSKSRPWRATGSQGTEFWGSTLEVEPVGDSRFWMEAVKVRLKEGYKQAETRDVGAFRFCRFQSFGPRPYAYWVGVRARGDNLEIAEFYFPDIAQQEKHLAAMLAAVEARGK